MRTTYNVMLIASMCCFSILPASSAELRYVTDNFPPFHYINDNGKTTGFAIDLLNEIWGEMGQGQKRVKVLPWARAYSIALNDKDTVLFNTLRTPSREKLFKWVCPIYEHKNVLIKLRKSDINLASLKEARNYKVMAVRADSGETILLERGIDKNDIYLSNKLDSALKMLMLERIDLLSVGLVPATQRLESMGYDSSLIEVSMVLSTKQSCFAFNLETNDQLIGKFKQAFQKVHKDQSRIDSLKKKYKMPKN
ncbi:transporter substrate-binding domain-containing protein [Vibrio profundum]|uniref:substrate-binding periplasmic protein n=1 Tax=Vibrio profundum TaxID=2910247 RepID=UPI003D0FD289